MILPTLIMLSCILQLSSAADNENSKQTSSDNKKPLTRGDMSYIDDLSVFQELTQEEIKSVTRYMLSQKKLKLKPFDKATLQDNHIYTMELYLPKKSTVLRYLDGFGPRPVRLARVTTVNGGLKTPDVAEYIVGPLPHPTFHKPHKFFQGKTRMPFHKRPVSVKETSISAVFIGAQVKKHPFIVRIMIESFGGDSVANGRLSFEGRIAFLGTTISGKRTSWLTTGRKLEGGFLHPLPLEFLLEHSDPDWRKWKILKVLYNNQIFSSIQEFIGKYVRGFVRKIKLPRPSRRERLGSTLRRRGRDPFGFQTRGPTLVEPTGRRFTINGRQVMYSNWQFDISVSTERGLGVFDVRYKEKRIAYEISFQEAAAFYSASSESFGSNQVIDSAYGIGASSFELVKGIDCPESAVYLDTIHLFDEGKARRNKNAICVFEMYFGTTNWRHREVDAQKNTQYYGGHPSYAIVVRAIAALDNYDYQLDYIFHLNGAIELRTSTSGNIQTNFYYKDERPFGFRNFGHAFGALHDHFMLYKIDFDIAGTKNSFQTLEVVPKSVTDKFSGAQVVKKFINRSKKRREKKAALRFNFNKPRYYLMVNERVKNRFGDPLGYRIEPVHHVKQLYPDKYHATRAAAWTKYDVAVTRRKDSEQTASTPHNQFEIHTVAKDFDTFIKDDEDIINKDLVAWVTIGGLHIPSTEDIPSTSSIGNAFTVFLRPYNYFPEDHTMGSRESVYIGRTKNGKLKTYTYGRPKLNICPKPKISYKHVFVHCNAFRRTRYHRWHKSGRRYHEKKWGI